MKKSNVLCQLTFLKIKAQAKNSLQVDSKETF